MPQVSGSLPIHFQNMPTIFIVFSFWMRAIVVRIAISISRNLHDIAGMLMRRTIVRVLTRPTPSAL